MRLIGRGVRLRALFSASILVGVIGGLIPAGIPAAADEGRTALALGDSVPFGYITHDFPAYSNADNFQGFPEHYARTLHMTVANASCPGETSESLITGQHDNGCQGFKGAPVHGALHVSYPGTQLEYAKSYLMTHHETRLVTLMVGANDAFLLQKHCTIPPATTPDPSCVLSQFGALLGSIGANLNTILTGIESRGFHGKVVVANYYSTDYTDTNTVALLTAINNTIAAVTNAHHEVVADAFSAFAARAAALPLPIRGQTCFTGLLNGDPAVDLKCDVHPSQTGQELLSNTVVNAYRNSLHNDERSHN